MLYSSPNVGYAKWLICANHKNKSVNFTGFQIDSEVVGIAANVFSPSTYLDSKPNRTIDGKLDLSQAENLKYICDNAFNGCRKMTGVLSFSRKLEYIGLGAFKDCENLTGLNFSIMSNRHNPCKICSQAFYKCKRISQALRIPNYVTWIGEDAFYEVDVQSSATNVLVTSNNDEGCNAWLIGGENSIDTTQTQITIPDNVYGIGGGAFKNNPNLVSITLGKNLKVIGESAFKNCSRLQTIIGSPLLESIDDNAFNGYSSLTNIPFGKAATPNLSRIGISAFENCGNMTGKIDWPNKITSVSDRAFCECTNINDFGLENSNIKTIGTNAFSNNFGASRLTCPVTLKTIKSNAFEGCSIQQIDLNSQLDEIGSCAFYNCKELTGDVVIPTNVSIIRERSFYGTNVKQFTFLSQNPTTLENEWYTPTNLRNLKVSFSKRVNLADFFNQGVSVESVKRVSVTSFTLKALENEFKVSSKTRTSFGRFRTIANPGASSLATYKIQSPNWQEIPYWISIDSLTGIITVTQDAPVGDYEFTVVATNAENSTKSASTNVKLHVLENYTPSPVDPVNPTPPSPVDPVKPIKPGNGNIDSWKYLKDNWWILALIGAGIIILASVFSILATRNDKRTKALPHRHRSK
ncbi:MAG: leucine-rich repeat protein [Mycoplasmataceae bacterium]|nr:leucine-rich repeat protein [Mycoplasmataceae bacterium]